MDKLKNLTAAAAVDFLLNLGNEAVRLIGGYAVILSPATIPLAPVSIITLLLYNTILLPIADWRLRLLISFLIGLALESFALACLIVSRHAEEFNLTREPDEPEMNQGAGRWALAAYIVLGISMVIVGEILPHYQWLEDAQIARWTLLGFFGLAPFGHWIFATEHNIRRLEARRKLSRIEAQAGRESDLRLAEQETARREREAAIREREAQAEAIASRARAAEIEAQARERQAEAEIIRRQAALVRAEARKEQQVERSGKELDRSRIIPEPNQEREAQLAQVLGSDRHVPFSVLEAMERADLTRKQFYNLMEYAQGRGYVERIGRGQYIYRNGNAEQ